MRTVGIIAEYNPFHTGHAYHLKKAKELSGADYAVVVMSPDFVQRGEPAVFDKYTRAQMALLNGADLVVELPVCYAAGSAEYFARGAVCLLESLGIVDTLCFGGECDDVRLFYQTASALLSEPEAYAQRLRQLLKEGKTYPRARCTALSEYFARELCTCGHTSFPEGISLQDFLSEPNNILGIEYCKALLKTGSSISVLPILRRGSRYSSPSLEGPYCSATAIRSAIQDGSIPESAAEEKLLNYIPDNCRGLFLNACRHPRSLDEFAACLAARLLSATDYGHILDITPELSDRLCSLRFSCIGKSFDETVALLKTKQMTEARIRRALLHLLLDIRTEDVNRFLSEGGVYYAKVLGFRRDASGLLHEIKEKSRVPFITKNARGKTLSAPSAKQMWEQDLFASHLYRSLLSLRCHTVFRSEYEISPVIL